MTETPELATPPAGSWRRVLPWAVVALVTAATVCVLHGLGRVWWCEGGRPFLWSGDVWSMHNSQHLADPYSFTHISHGLIFALLFAHLPPFRKWSFAWRMVPAVTIEALWEIVENTPLVINRYRETTMALGYNGDSIGNSLGDIACFILGFAFATGVRWYWTVSLFLATELILLLTIRDNLLLNVLMLLWPIDAVREWQTVGV
jgi:Protein of unknown function (DUF2585)